MTKPESCESNFADLIFFEMNSLQSCDKTSTTTPAPTTENPATTKPKPDKPKLTDEEKEAKKVKLLFSADV